MRAPFAFLIHPRNDLRTDLGLLFGAPFRLIPNSVSSAAMAHLPFPPIETGQVSYKDDPDVVAGRIYTVPFSGAQLLTLPRKKVQAKISEAVDRARDDGASLIGLGGLTAPAALGGKILRGRDDIGVTNGNAFTAAMTYIAFEKIVPSLPEDPIIALVGATGSVGTCLTHLIARRFGAGRLLLVARHKGRLDALADVVRKPDLPVETSVDMGDVARADLVILLTSATEALLRSEHLKRDAIVLDDTVPRNTDERLLTERPDIAIIDGGLMSMTGMTMTGSIGLPPNIIYACLAETMLLALDGHSEHFAIGAPTVDQADHMVGLAARHSGLGFALAPFRSFGRPIAEACPSFAARHPSCVG